MDDKTKKNVENNGCLVLMLGFLGLIIWFIKLCVDNSH
jgi:hypothetical protein